MCQIFFTFLTRVVLVTVTNLFPADASVITTFTACFVIFVDNFGNLGCNKLRRIIIFVFHHRIGHTIANECWWDLNWRLHVVDYSLIRALWARIVTVHITSLQIDARAVGDIETIHWELMDISTIFTVIWVFLCHNRWFLNEKFIKAALSERATTERDDWIAQLNHAVPHASIELT